MEELTIESKQSCQHCGAEIKDEQKFCISCGYPQKGTEAEKSKFHAERIINHSKTQEAPSVIKKSRNALFIIGGLNFLFGAFLFITKNDVDSFIGGIILAVIYLLLGFWSQKRPLIALVLGLLVYATTIVLAAILDPSSIYRGIIVKIIIIVYLAKGINSALYLRNSK